MAKPGFDAEFDVVVVGAGSAGCVLSARLTENPEISLCVIEAGGRDRNPWIHIPMGFGKLVPNPNVNWGYETEPEPGLGGRSIIWPRGKVVGGSGSINGLVFLRGAPSDYDEWQRLGAQGWSYKDVLPYFKRMEHCVDGADEWRGTGGPMTISNIKRPSTVAKAFVEACERLQYPRNRDFNGERIDGVGFAPLNVHNGWRRSTAVGYLKPNLNRQNLELMTRNPCAANPVRGPPRRRRRGRARRTDPAHRRAARTRSCPAARSIRRCCCWPPASVRPASSKAHGIEVQHRSARRRQEPAGSLPGELRLQDQRGDTLNEAVMSPIKSARLALEWLFTGSGQLAVGATEATMFCKSQPVGAGAGPAVPVLNFSSDSLKDRPAQLAGLHLHLQRLPAEEPRRDHAARQRTAECRRGSSPTT